MEASPLMPALFDYLSGRQDQMVEELGRYVSCESGSYDKAGIDRVGAEVAAAFRELGFTIDTIPETEFGNHLVARRRGSGVGRLLALIHLDTIWPAGTLAENPFRVSDGRAYGPGILDMKGGWVVLLEALRALAHVGWDGLASTTVFMTGDEQLGSARGRPWIEKEAESADWSLVMEPAREGGHLCIQRSLLGSMIFDVTGKPAHTVRSHQGASAIDELAYKIVALRELHDPERGVLVNVGLIEGGSARQVLAGRAKATIDVRAPNSELADELMTAVREIGERVYVPGTTTTVTGRIHRPAFIPSEGTRQLLALAQKQAAALGMQVEGVGTQGGSDGCFTAAMGVPTLDGLGPEGFHSGSRDECVLIESLPRRAALLAGLIASLPTLL